MQSVLDVVVPAAGVGSRMGASIPKQYLEISGKQILDITVSTLLKSPYVGSVIVVVDKNDSYFDKLPIASNARVIKAIGGNLRVDSVLNGLKEAKTEYVMVHDAARPLISLGDIEKLVLDTVGKTNIGGILVSPVADTLKSAINNHVIKTVSRENMYRAQTPQLFKRDLLIQAIEYGLSHDAQITDEASAVEFYGFSPCVIIGRSDNFKITTKDDLQMARALFAYKDSDKC